MIGFQNAADLREHINRWRRQIDGLVVAVKETTTRAELERALGTFVVDVQAIKDEMDGLVAAPAEDEWDRDARLLFAEPN